MASVLLTQPGPDSPLTNNETPSPKATSKIDNKVLIAELLKLELGTYIGGRARRLTCNV